ncbi:glycerol-3-phosphate dehydrogenase [NAD+] [Cokeromyces recurvatus]|uniref:glycerol-3-phosphate dehydrogenase [NAD+] n=1 Tax=Cokeromyces recurvatus TaxID=90255 RepID=UPI00221FA106|nr:glycerol-3-phosphate dehydrogenase [NAD+] [Cokeromyces recurvatus]KAI7900751.1 glycerol-3-phosphate dehydrogenase [NAD+] [Cokeromyces recurvatus]
MSTVSKQRVTIIGSGNWGSSIARVCAQNTIKHSDFFEREVRMWVYEEQIDGRNLTDIINEKHENVKYLPNINLGENVVAIPDVKEAAKGANVLVFVLPHQFVYKVCETLRDVISKDCKAISLIKGLDYKNNNLLIFSEEIEKILGIHCAALSGANIASEVAEEQFGETTIACRDLKDAEIFYKLFHTDYFDVNVIGDWRGLQVCGALKNVVALGAGICDGLHYGNNTKSAVIRRGLVEMRKFGKTFFGGVHTETYFESCGVADLITTCAGGRNRKVAAAFIKSNKSIEEVEKEMLNGQKLQGTTTSQEVFHFLSARNMTQEFPLLTAIYRVIYENAPPESIALDLRTRNVTVDME